MTLVLPKRIEVLRFQIILLFPDKKMQETPDAIVS